MSAELNGKRYHVELLNDPALWDGAPIEPKTPPNPLKNDKEFLRISPIWRSRGSRGAAGYPQEMEPDRGRDRGAGIRAQAAIDTEATPGTFPYRISERRWRQIWLALAACRVRSTTRFELLRPGRSVPVEGQPVVQTAPAGRGARGARADRAVSRVGREGDAGGSGFSARAQYERRARDTKRSCGETKWDNLARLAHYTAKWAATRRRTVYTRKRKTN